MANSSVTLGYCHLFIVSSDLADDIVEGVVDIDTGFGRGFDEGTAELTSKILPFWKVEFSQLGSSTSLEQYQTDETGDVVAMA